jgi:hypothetical protein
MTSIAGGDLALLAAGAQKWFGGAMIPGEVTTLRWLCERLINEKDPQAFNGLVLELNRLLEAKKQRIEALDERLNEIAYKDIE